MPQRLQTLVFSADWEDGSFFNFNPVTSTVFYVDENDALIIHDPFEDFTFTTDICCGPYNIDCEKHIVFGRDLSGELFAFDHVNLKSVETDPNLGPGNIGRESFHGCTFAPDSNNIFVTSDETFCLDVKLVGNADGLICFDALQINREPQLVYQNWILQQQFEEWSIQFRIFVPDNELLGRVGVEPFGVLGCGTSCGWQIIATSVPFGRWNTICCNFTKDEVLYVLNGVHMNSDSRAGECTGILSAGSEDCPCFLIEAIRVRGRLLTETELREASFVNLLSIEVTHVDLLHSLFAWNARDGAIAYGLDVFTDGSLWCSRRDISDTHAVICSFDAKTMYKTILYYTTDGIHYKEDDRYAPLEFEYDSDGIPQASSFNAFDVGDLGDIDLHISRVRDGGQVQFRQGVACVVSANPQVSVINDLQNLVLPFSKHGPESQETSVRYKGVVTNIAYNRCTNCVIIDGTSYSVNERVPLFGRRFRLSSLDP